MGYTISLTEVNKLDGCEFERKFGNVIEMCVDAAVQVKKKRSFVSVDELINSFAAYLDNLSENGELLISY